jgi:hypothetical protein
MPDPHRTPIDFARLDAALLARAEDLVSSWLPGGCRRGPEYVCGDLGGGKGHSCSVNLTNGKWSDFQTGEGGSDLTSLYAAIQGLSQGKAARELEQQLGLVAGPPAAPGAAAPARAPRASPPAEKPAAPSTGRPPAEDEGWRTQRPVPAHAPAPTFKHAHREAADIEHVAEYRTGEDLHGYVVRFRTSDGGKDTLPHTWCVSQTKGGARWHWKQFDQPRPLYLPAHALPGAQTIIVVEGEKKAGLLHELLQTGAPGVYAVAGWPGGCKTWQLAQWEWLAGRHVVLWPDCDAKRHPLTPAERKATPDRIAQEVLQAAKPMLAAERQPGMRAMLGIGALLRDAHGCTVQMLPIPEPGAVPDGWDCGDAIATDGWDFARVLGFLAQASALPAWAGGDKPAATADAPPPPECGTRDPRATAQGADGGGDAFEEHLAWLCVTLKCERWDLGVNRKLIIAALTKAPLLQDCLGYNELTGAPSTTVPWPWRSQAGALAEADDLRLGEWLCATYKLKAASRAALAEAMDTVADMRRFHPVRDWLKGQRWDGKRRRDKWLMHVLGIDPATLPPARREYFALVGRFILAGLVARVMTPGCKFDYSPVFEGPPGVGKSTFVQELVGAAYFSDTHFDIGNGKDGMEQFDGLWAYELSELTAFRRADSEQIKQFFSSRIDRFRGAYGKYVQPHPRQLVIFCTTNKRQYLYDLTGNRRFWPIWIDKRIRLDWLRKWRGQLFAEALAAWQAGERIAPIPEEEEAYFVPEQELRLVETTVQSKLYDLLTREGSPASEGGASNYINMHSQFVTMHGLTLALGTDAAKATSLLESQIRGWLEAHGWEYTRESVGQRRRGFARPDVWPPEVKDDTAPVGAEQSPTAEADPARDDASDGISDDEPF